MYCYFDTGLRDICYQALLATPTGLEPVISAVTGRRSDQLNYGATETPNKMFGEILAQSTLWQMCICVLILHLALSGVEPLNLGTRTPLHNTRQPLP